MAIKVNKGNGASKGSFANNKKVIMRPLSIPTTPSRTATR